MHVCLSLLKKLWVLLESSFQPDNLGSTALLTAHISPAQRNTGAGIPWYRGQTNAGSLAGAEEGGIIGIVMWGVSGVVVLCFVVCVVLVVGSIPVVAWYFCRRCGGDCHQPTNHEPPRRILHHSILHTSLLAYNELLYNNL
jgi:hypothetical protein